jgi:hypothetical protein
MHPCARGVCVCGQLARTPHACHALLARVGAAATPHKLGAKHTQHSAHGKHDGRPTELAAPTRACAIPAHGAVARARADAGSHILLRAPRPRARAPHHTRSLNREVDLPDDAFTDDASAAVHGQRLTVTIPRRDPLGPAMQVRARARVLCWSEGRPPSPCMHALVVRQLLRHVVTPAPFAPAHTRTRRPLQCITP